MRKLSILIIAVVGLLFVAPPASATNTVRDNPWLMSGWEIYQRPADTGPLTAVLVGPRNTWGIRDTAKNIDDRVANLVIHRRVGIKCNDIPARSMCIRVKKVYRPGAGWWGQASIENGIRVVKLNTAEPPSQKVAAHELGHVFGIGHHRQRGSVNRSIYMMTKYLSKAEIGLIKGQF